MHPQGKGAGAGTLDGQSRTSWLFLLDWGVVALTLTAAGASAFAALIAFRHDDPSAMAEAGLACCAAFAAAWLGRSASRAAKRWQAELIAWHGNDIVLLLDESGRVLDANDRALEAYGMSLDALFKLHVRELRDPGAKDGIELHLSELRSSGRAVFETVQRKADGTPFPVEVSARVVSMQGRRCLHFIARDVSEAHRARSRIVAAERLAAVGTVAAGMAHDVNNPLCGVLGNLSFANEALGDEAPDLVEIGRALQDATTAARRVRDLMRDLSAFSNAFGETGGESDLRAVVAEAVELSRPLLGDRARVVVDVPTLPPVQCPARRLSPVFTSILRRAADAMPAGDAIQREIRIVARREGHRQLAVEVADDGPTLQQVELAGPLEPLHGRNRVTRGGGAGLAAVIGMVQAVGGDVVAESAPGQGNVVRVLLPLSGPVGRA